MNKELADLRKKSVEQLSAELMSARETQFGLRIKHKTGQLNEVSDLVKVRKKIAVIKTLINEKERIRVKGKNILENNLNNQK